MGKKKNNNTEPAVVNQETQDLPLDNVSHEEVSCPEDCETKLDLEAIIKEKDATIESLKAEIKELEDRPVKSHDSALIMDEKKLDPEKSYVTGPNGIGFVEAK